MGGLFGGGYDAPKVMPVDPPKTNSAEAQEAAERERRLARMRRGRQATMLTSQSEMAGKQTLGQ